MYFLKVWWGHVNVISHSRCSFLKELLIIYSFLAALGLQCCAWAFCSCGEQGLLAGCDTWACHLGGFSSWGAQASVGVARAQELWLPGPGVRGLRSCGSWAPECEGSGAVAQDLVALRHVGSSRIRDGTHVSCVGRRTLYYWATREVLGLELLKEVILCQCFQFLHGHWFRFDVSTWINFNHSLN